MSEREEMRKMVERVVFDYLTEREPTTMGWRLKTSEAIAERVADAILARRSPPQEDPGDGWWLLQRMFNVCQAAQRYYDGYCQDEAADDGMDFTGCSWEQHHDAKALRDALSDYSGEEALCAVQAAAPLPPEGGKGGEGAYATGPGGAGADAPGASVSHCQSEGGR